MRRLSKDGEALLHQQLWCVGADIRRCEGNLLLAFGAERARPGVGEPGSSRYVVRQGDAVMALWGFGCCFGDPARGSVVLRRYAFRPRWSAEADPPATHTIERLGAWHHPMDIVGWARALSLTADACDWFADYEQFVRRTAGGAWRRDVLAHWDSPHADARAVIGAWQALAEGLRAQAARHHS